MDANLEEIKEDIKTNLSMLAGAIQAKAETDREHTQEMMTTNQERTETKMDAIQEQKDANLSEIIVELKDGRKEKTAGQEVMEANLEKMEPNPREKEAVAERQVNPNEEVAIHSLRA
jgi:CRISPR/Cas system-associated exonuclease Cas4 (RecB family)